MDKDFVTRVTSGETRLDPDRRRLPCLEATQSWREVEVELEVGLE